MSEPIPLLAYTVTYGAPSLVMTAVFWIVLPLVYFKWLRPGVRRWLNSSHRA